ncbi:MAG TPA: imidazole glycerol phosphate synthase subunit HisH [Gammaproteobacteria bacterium]
MQTIAIIDYGMGNLHSIAKALERVAADTRVRVTAEPRAILAADRVVFPGVGAIRDCMAELRARALVPVVCEAAATRPFLGICLGLQLLLEHSEENDGVDCLGIVPGRVRRFPGGRDAAGARLKIPHMGWNVVAPTRPHPLWAGIPAGSRFYFVHSYYVDPAEPAQVAATCAYGVTFAAALARGNLFAVQFHPEKSDRHGLRLLGNFAAWDGTAA